MPSSRRAAPRGAGPSQRPRRWRAPWQPDLLRREAGPIAGIGSLAALVLPGWYRGQQLLWGPDATTIPPLRIDNLAPYFSIAEAGLGIPHVRKLPFLLPLGGFFALWSELSLPYDPALVQRFLVFGLLVGSGLSMYWMLRSCLPSVTRLPALGASLFYMFNLYTAITNWYNTPNLIFHYSFLPLVVGLWINQLRTGSIKSALMTAAIWSLTLTPGYTTTPLVITDVAVFAAVTALYLVQPRHTSRRRSLLLCGITLSTWASINLFWMVPLIYYFDIEAARQLAAADPQKLFALNSAPLEWAVRLGGYWGLTEAYKGSPYFPWWSYYVGPLEPATWSVPVVGLVGWLWLSVHWMRSRQSANSANHALLFGILLVAFLVFMTGSRPPFGRVTAALMESAGLTGPFRSVYQRFGVYAALFYAPLLAGGLHALSVLVRPIGTERTGTVVGRMVCITATAILVCTLAFPMLTGLLFDRSGLLPSHRITIPRDYYRVATWLDRHGPGGLTLALPFPPNPVTALSWKEGAEGYRATEPLALLSSAPMLLADSPLSYLTPSIRSIARGEPGAGEALRALNVRFVVLHRDAHRGFIEGRSDWIGGDVSALDRRLARSALLEPALRSDTLHVYRVESWVPAEVFAISNYSGGSIYSSSVDLRPIRYRSDSPSRYIVPPGEVAPGDILVVNRSYDPLWRVNGREPISVAPGVTGFVIADEGPLVVQHQLDRWFPWLLLTAPLGLVVALAAASRLERRSP